MFLSTRLEGECRMSRKRRRQRDERRALQTFIDAMVENAEDPRRQALADVIEVVLKRAGFRAAEMEPASEGGFPVRGTQGFWMRVDSLGPGIMLYATGYDEANDHFMQRYQMALLRAFSPTVGASIAAQHIALHLGGVCIVPFTARQIQTLHRRFARQQ